jgi:ferritin-like metal-binding protein YciE
MYPDRFSSLDDLLIAQIEDLYYAEKRMVVALPKMMEAAHAVALKKAFEAHFAQTLQHVTRLDEVFKRLHRSPHGNTSQAVKGLLSDSDQPVTRGGSRDVMDAALIASAQRVEHYEMAAYGTARTFASELGQPEIADLLNRTLQEELAADRKLTEIAETEVNVRAAQ